MTIENKSELILEIAGVKDAGDYLWLEKQVRGRTYSALAKEKEFLKEIRPAAVYFFKIKDKVIGHITYKAKEDGNVHLGGFAIVPEYQGRGLGRKAMELILALAKNAPKIDLVAHPDNFKAISLYESLGFKITERRENYYGDGEPRVVLVKNRSIP
ncbi:MAG TPA: N-acetyltransferase [Candidatus Paceibacterota bacterium]|nr:N-acetyltransferase [Candidatus Pacearchaeota archaeon]HRZ50905.1 N-acetyltransferase [Candidatus Paceibacterota bacterium]HSA36626.1 N-acetyltransferase [Candidatus Paceibacterota bacterium]